MTWFFVKFIVSFEPHFAITFPLLITFYVKDDLVPSITFPHFHTHTRSAKVRTVCTLDLDLTLQKAKIIELIIFESLMEMSKFLNAVWAIEKVVSSLRLNRQNKLSLPIYLIHIVEWYRSVVLYLLRSAIP